MVRAAELQLFGALKSRPFCEFDELHFIIALRELNNLDRSTFRDIWTGEMAAGLNRMRASVGQAPHVTTGRRLYYSIRLNSAAISSVLLISPNLYLYEVTPRERFEKNTQIALVLIAQ